jgi:hypothetical protein
MRTFYRIRLAAHATGNLRFLKVAAVCLAACGIGLAVPPMASLAGGVAPSQAMLLASYLFNGDAQDESGNGHHGVVHGAALVPNRFGNADASYAFSAVNSSRIELGDMPELDIQPTDVRSISLWFFAQDPGDAGSDALITKGRETYGWDPRWYLHYNYAQQRLMYQVADGTGDENGGTPSGSVVGNVWHHLVMVIDRPGAVLKLYLDGTLLHTHVIQQTGAFANDNQVAIGATNDAPNAEWRDFFSGKIDDVQVYEGALSEPEIAELYHVNGWGTALPPALAAYVFEGNAADVTGNGHDGAVVGPIPITDRFGSADKAYALDPLNSSRIELGDMPELDIQPTDVRSISLWFFAQDPGDADSDALITKGQETYGWDPRWYLMYNYAQQRLVYQVADGTGDENGDTPSGSVVGNVWHHLVMVIDRPGAVLKLYLDGTLLHTHVIQQTGAFANDNQVAIGATNDAPNAEWRDFFSGKIDDVSIYDRELSPEQIVALYHVGGWADVTPVFLDSYAAHIDGTDVRLEWRLAAPAEDATFVVLRSDGPSDGFVELSVSVQRDHTDFIVTDQGCEPGRTYRYRVDVVQGGARTMLFATTGVVLPAPRFALYPNCPNPFNPATDVEFAIERAGTVNLCVHDLAGRVVRTLANGDFPAGQHRVRWDGRDDVGSPVASGMYILRLAAEGGSASRKLTLTK